MGSPGLFDMKKKTKIYNAHLLMFLVLTDRERPLSLSVYFMCKTLLCRYVKLCFLT